MTLHPFWEGTKMSDIQQNGCKLKISEFKTFGFGEEEHLTHNFLIMGGKKS